MSLLADPSSYPGINGEGDTTKKPDMTHISSPAKQTLDTSHSSDDNPKENTAGKTSSPNPSPAQQTEKLQGQPSPVTTVIPQKPCTALSTLRNLSFDYSSGEHILIDRDYRQRFTIRFSTQFPEVLQNRLDPTCFAFTVTQINSMFQNAEKYNWKTFCQSFFGFLTANFIYKCWKSKYEKCLSDVSHFVISENRQVYLPRGLHLVDPSLKGLRNLEIVILNTQ